MLWQMIARVVVVLALLAAPASADPVRKPTCADPPAKPRAPREITDVDWCNHDFLITKGPLRRGSSSLHLYRSLGGPHDTIITTLAGIVYGDLDGDRKPEAAIVLEKATWTASRNEPATNTDVYVYTFARGKPVMIGAAGAGRPVHDITFKRGVISVTSGDPKQTARYRRGKDDLTPIEPARR